MKFCENVGHFYHKKYHEQRGKTDIMNRDSRQALNEKVNDKACKQQK